MWRRQYWTCTGDNTVQETILKLCLEKIFNLCWKHYCAVSGDNMLQLSFKLTACYICYSFCYRTALVMCCNILLQLLHILTTFCYNSFTLTMSCIPPLLWTPRSRRHEIAIYFFFFFVIRLSVTTCLTWFSHLLLTFTDFADRRKHRRKIFDLQSKKCYGLDRVCGCVWGWVDVWVRVGGSTWECGGLDRWVLEGFSGCDIGRVAV